MYEGQTSQDEYLRRIIREEVARLAAGSGRQTLGGAGLPGGQQMPPGQHARQQAPLPLGGDGMAPDTSFAAPPASIGSPGAMPSAAPPGAAPQMAAGAVAGTFPDTHAQILQSMATNLQKLRAVLVETEQIAQRMEDLLSRQVRLDLEQDQSLGQGQGQGPEQERGRNQGQGGRRQGQRGQDGGSQTQDLVRGLLGQGGGVQARGRMRRGR